MKYELHALGEKFIVEQGIEISGADVLSDAVAPSPS